MTYETLAIDRRGEVDWLTLNRPDQLNALNPTMMEELRLYFESLRRNLDVRVVVMRGAGKAFCAGLDIKQASDRHQSVGKHGPTRGFTVQRRVSDIVLAMRRCPQPIVSVIQGAAAGGGLSLALASDIRICGPRAKFNAAFIKLGLSGCDMGVSYFLPRLIGVSTASMMLMTGRFLDANRALATGLVTDLVEEDQLEACAQGYVDDLLHASPIGLRLTKDGLNFTIDAPSLEAAVAIEDRNQVLTLESGEVTEGLKAFVEKRRPKYQGT